MNQNNNNNNNKRLRGHGSKTGQPPLEGDDIIRHFSPASEAPVYQDIAPSVPLLFFFFPWDIHPLQSDWSLSSHHGFEYKS